MRAPMTSMTMAPLPELVKMPTKPTMPRKNPNMASNNPKNCNDNGEELRRFFFFGVDVVKSFPLLPQQQRSYHNGFMP